MLESRNSKRMMGTNIETTSYDANKIRALIAGLWKIHYWYAKSTITRKIPIFFIYRRYILVRTVTQHSYWTSIWSPLAVTTALIQFNIIKWLINVFLGYIVPLFDDSVFEVLNQLNLPVWSQSSPRSSIPNSTWLYYWLIFIESIEVEVATKGDHIKRKVQFWV